ncbi:tRNA (adenosine(37)-N6)-threonylcarbamoyltransferase complex transferase subunit TsaD, partial [candidate division KSB1 bacterium]|nr:tRNA (adenosine(37)-N6)-threonylcarbamoyltransferase complex transferase subunit TsaD [candidate division KSB1 bacterium]
QILDLGYPGGPVIDAIAKKGTHRTPHFKCAPLTGSYNFSFSGIKTAVLYHHRDHKDDSGFSVKHVAYAFQKSIVTNLTQKKLSLSTKNITGKCLTGDF